MDSEWSFDTDRDKDDEMFEEEAKLHDFRNGERFWKEQEMVKQILNQIEEKYQSYTNFIKELEKHRNATPKAAPFISAEIVFLKDIIDPFYEPTIKNMFKRLLNKLELYLFSLNDYCLVFTLNDWLPDPYYYKLEAFLYPKAMKPGLRLPENFPVIDKNSE